MLQRFDLFITAEHKCGTLCLRTWIQMNLKAFLKPIQSSLNPKISLSLTLLMWILSIFYPRTYTQIHTPTVVKGRVSCNPPPPSFRYVAVFWNDFAFSGVFHVLNEMRYILWMVALLEACDVTTNGRHLGRHLGFYQELEIRLKPHEMVSFCAGHVQ